MTAADPVEPAPNLPLLRSVLAQIDAHPETWEQGHWAVRQGAGEQCRTAFCVAGWAVVLSGGTPEWGNDTGPNLAGYATMPDGTTNSIQDAAADLLGLIPTEVNALFEGSSTRRRVQTVAERVAARAGERL